MIYFTSDLHFNHNNIVELSNRPCSVKDHNEWIFSKLEHIKEDDIVYHLGDFAFGNPNQIASEIFPRLVGHWYWIKGNHDRELEKASKIYAANSNKRDSFKDTFCEPFIQEKINDKIIIMCHYPFQSWNKDRYGSIHLHGHCHGRLNDVPIAKNRIDVGLDANNFEILNYDDMIRKINEKNDFIEDYLLTI